MVWNSILQPTLPMYGPTNKQVILAMRGGLRSKD
jgi:hypothetical protein